MGAIGACSPGYLVGFHGLTGQKPSSGAAVEWLLHARHGSRLWDAASNQTYTELMFWGVTGDSRQNKMGNLRKVSEDGMCLEKNSQRKGRGGGTVICKKAVKEAQT